MSDLSQTVEHMRSGKLSVVEHLETFLDRVAARDGAIHAWIHIDADALRAEAAHRDGLESAERIGVLFGVPVAVKDIFDTADMPTGYGSPIYAGHQPRTDAACVAALKRAGAIIMGKTVTTEFAASHPGATVNPHDPTRTPGGSSSGSAAAVACAMAPAALGTQTAGSVVRPASFCGVVGYKPTFNMINRAGLKPLSESTDTIGVLADSVDTAAHLVAAMAGRMDLVGRNHDVGEPRIALVKTFAWGDADAGGKAALIEAGERLCAAGANVVEVALPDECEALGAAGMRILSRDAAAALGHERNVANDRLSENMRDLVARGLDVDPSAYDQAHALAARCRALVEDALFGPYDAVLALSAPGEAPVGLQSTGSPVFNHIWTLLHMPCVSIPGMRGPASMPIGVQLVGRRGADTALLSLAAWAEDLLTD
jgi:amidase